jgi:Tetratricopeptide repeat
MLPPISSHAEDTPVGIPNPKDLLCLDLSEHSQSSSSLGFSSRPSSSSTENCHTESSIRAAHDREISPTLSPSRPSSLARQVSHSASSSGPATTTSASDVTPTWSSTGSASPYRSIPSSNRYASGERIWGNIRPDGFNPKMGSGFNSSPKTRVLSFGNKDYGYGSIINTRKNVTKETVLFGNNALEKGMYKEALQEFDKAIRMRPNDAKWRIIRADTLVQLGRFEEALREYFEAHELDPENGRLHYRMSLFQLRQVVKHRLICCYLLVLFCVSLFVGPM